MSPLTPFTRTERREPASARARTIRVKPDGTDYGVLSPALFIGLTALVMFGALAFGAVEPWAMLTQQLLAAGLLLLWIAGYWRRKLAFHYSPLFLPAGALGLWIGVQLAQTSAYRNATLLAALQAAAYGALLFLATQTLASEEHAGRFGRALIAFGGVLAFVSICFHFASPVKIYGLREPHAAGMTFGPYVNHNHYAGLMEMLAPFPLLMALGRNARSTAHMTYAMAGFVISASIFLSGSRGGMISLAVEFAVICLVALRDTREQQARRAVLVALGFMAIFLAMYGSTEMAARLSSFRHPELSAETRVQIAKDTVRMAMARPVFGWGLGTFSAVYPEFRSFYTDMPVHAAHNDFAQAMSELGLVGSALLLWLLYGVFRAAPQSAPEWKRSSAAAARLAALIGVGGLLLHGFSDFNLQIPGNAALFFALCALATAATKSAAPASIAWGRLAAGAVAVAVLFGAFVSLCSYREQRIAATWDAAPLARAIRLNPLDAQPWMRLGQLALFEQQDAAEAERDLDKALALNPHEARAWLELAQAEQALGSDADEQRALAIAVKSAPTTPTYLITAATLYFSSGEQQLGLSTLRQVVQNTSDLLPASVDLAWRATHDTSAIMREAVGGKVDGEFALLQTLIEHNQVAAASDVWDAISKGSFDAKLAFPYLQFLIERDQGTQARKVWEQITAAPEYAAYRSGENRIVNGSFEAGTLNAGLDWRYTTTPNVNIFIDPKAAQDGARSVALTFHGEVAAIGLLQFVPVSPATTYHLSGYFESADLDGAGGLQWQVNENITGAPLGATPTLAAASGWQEFGADFTTGPQTHIVMLRLVRVPEGNVLTGKMWFDNLSLTQK